MALSRRVLEEQFIIIFSKLRHPSTHPLPPYPLERWEGPLLANSIFTRQTLKLCTGRGLRDTLCACRYASDKREMMVEEQIVTALLITLARLASTKTISIRIT